MPPPPHLAWLRNTNQSLRSVDGKSIDVWNLNPTQDASIISAWASHFRGHYCGETEIDTLRNGTGHSRADYLVRLKFPDQTEDFGPATRSGDFAEILVADYVEYCLNCWVPRTRYDRKTIRNESTKGSDVVGCWFRQTDRQSPEDTLVIYESKAQLAGRTANARLQDAIDDSAKDELRRAETLNSIKQRLIDRSLFADIEKVERFQNPEDRPFQKWFGAVAVFSSHLLNETQIAASNAAAHPNTSNLSLLVIHGDQLMALANRLYEVAANEA